MKIDGLVQSNGSENLRIFEYLHAKAEEHLVRHYIYLYLILYHLDYLLVSIFYLII